MRMIFARAKVMDCMYIYFPQLILVIFLKDVIISGAYIKSKKPKQVIVQAKLLQTTNIMIYIYSFLCQNFS